MEAPRRVMLAGWHGGCGAAQGPNCYPSSWSALCRAGKGAPRCSAHSSSPFLATLYSEVTPFAVNGACPQEGIEKSSSLEPNPMPLYSEVTPFARGMPRIGSSYSSASSSPTAAQGWRSLGATAEATFWLKVRKAAGGGLCMCIYNFGIMLVRRITLTLVWHYNAKRLLTPELDGIL